MKWPFGVMVFIAVLALGVRSPPAPPPKTPPHKAAQHKAPPKKYTEQPFFTETGTASLYSNRLVGRKTAAGSRFAQDGFTAAHKTLPFGTILKVTKLETGLSVYVAINDRGPHAKGRIIDLSSVAARALDIRKDGTANVKLEAFKTDQLRTRQMTAEAASPAP